MENNNIFVLDNYFENKRLRESLYRIKNIK